MRSIEMSAKTVEAAVQAACEALGVDRDDINVSYEVLEFPARKLFKTIPAKVLVKVEEPEVEEVKPVEDAPAPVEAIAAPAEEAAPAVEPAAEESAEAPVEEDASADEEVPLDIAADPRLQALCLHPLQGLQGTLPGGIPGRQIQQLVRLALPHGLESREQHRRAFARAGGQTGEQPLLPADGRIDPRGQLPLPGPVGRKGKVQRPNGSVPLSAVFPLS